MPALWGSALAAAGVVVFAVAAALADPGIFTVRQNWHGDASVVTIDPATGNIRDKSPLTFNFEFPLVETTVDATNALAYLVTIGQSGAELYTLDGHNGLQIVNQWQPAGVDFFDLQYNTAQSALYGISVVSRYGRVLSNFTLGPAGSNNVTIDHLVQMPMNWYVNASSFDPATDRYFALLNEFPGMPNDTLAQKVVIADFSQPPVPPNPSPATIFDIGSADGSVIWHFIGWNAAEQTVYGLATAASQLEPDRDTTWVTTIDLTSGEVELLYAVESFESGPTFPGPLMIDPDSGAMYAYVRSIPTGVWSLVMLGGQNGGSVIARYDAEWAFRAGTWADW